MTGVLLNSRDVTGRRMAEQFSEAEVRALLCELMANKDARTVSVSGLNFDVFSTGEALLVQDFSFENVLEEFKGVLNCDLKSFAERFGVNGLIIALMRAEGGPVAG
jgi:c-di-GMP-related signal transduction protein